MVFSGKDRVAPVEPRGCTRVELLATCLCKRLARTVSNESVAKEVFGTLEDIDPVADMKTKNVYLKISIDPPDLVAQNMSATVSVPVSKRQTLSIINRASVIKFQGKDFVYTIKEGKAAILPVNIVAYLGDKVGVDNPYIVPGMPVVTEGNERLRPDQPVTVGE